MDLCPFGFLPFSYKTVWLSVHLLLKPKCSFLWLSRCAHIQITFWCTFCVMKWKEGEALHSQRRTNFRHLTSFLLWIFLTVNQTPSQHKDRILDARVGESFSLYFLFWGSEAFENLWLLNTVRSNTAFNKYILCVIIFMDYNPYIWFAQYNFTLYCNMCAPFLLTMQERDIHTYTHS